MIYRVAVCDDTQRDLEDAASAVTTLLGEHGLECHVDRFRSAAGLLNARRKGGRWDIILLDIIMSGQSGIDLADALRRDGDDTDLIFVTRSPEFALAGYRSYPVSYLLKPITREKLMPVLTHCLERRQQLPSLVLDDLEGGKTTILLGQIRYIEVFRRELVVHGKDRDITCLGPLSAAVAALPEGCFFQCHRSYVVNLAYVSGIERYRFLLRGGGEVPISMRCYNEAQQEWLDFLK